MPADVAEADGAEAGVANGMNQDVGIGMAVQTLAVLDFYPTENQITSADQRMDIITVSDAHHARTCCCFRYSSASMRSSGSVILMLSE